MSLIHCEITLDLNWSEKCVICEANRATTFAMTSSKRYFQVVTLSTQDITFNYYNQSLKEQSTEINVNQKCWQKPKTDI